MGLGLQILYNVLTYCKLCIYLRESLDYNKHDRKWKCSVHSTPALPMEARKSQHSNGRA